VADKKLHTVIIEKLITGGFGLGRLRNGIVVLVRYVLPKERVAVYEVKRKKDYIVGTLKEILSPAPERIAAPCPVYTKCGGCDLQHADPAAQPTLQRDILADSLLRSGGDILGDISPCLEEPSAPPKQFGYRQRLRLHVDKSGSFGFFRPESHVIEPVTECLLAEKQVNTVLRLLHNSDCFRKLVVHSNEFELLYNPAGATVTLQLHFRRRPRPADCQLAGEMKNIPGLGDILMQVEGHGLYDPLQRVFLKHPPILSHTVPIKATAGEFTFTWEAGGFCQVNLEQNMNMVKLVLEMMGPGPCGRALDLFCGYGNFSLPTALRAEEVLGIDSQNSAIRSARRNAALNKVTNCSFEKNLVPAAVKSLSQAGLTFDTVILDPPRQGAADIMTLLPGLNPGRVIYVSCNPATLARDLALLLPAGYCMTRLVPIDMFPQTHHLESVALLERSHR
jgi:23S rRNA (uracil1939-C5)-methyltransferase